MSLFSERIIDSIEERRRQFRGGKNNSSGHAYSQEIAKLDRNLGSVDVLGELVITLRWLDLSDLKIDLETGHVQDRLGSAIGLETFLLAQRVFGKQRSIDIYNSQ